jgi:hypothetical protein
MACLLPVVAEPALTSEASVVIDRLCARRPRVEAEVDGHSAGGQGGQGCQDDDNGGTHGIPALYIQPRRNANKKTRPNEEGLS